jgi:hypothetical protein
MPRKRSQKKQPADSPGQQHVPFWRYSAAYEEERGYLGLAVMRLRCDLHEVQFLLWLFNTTEAGRKGTLQKSYKQIADWPWGLCCSPDKAESTVQKLQRKRLCHVEETWNAQGIQTANRYTYDRDLILAACGLRRQPPAAEAAPPAAEAAPPAAEAAPPAAQAHIRNNTSSHLFSPFHTSFDRSRERAEARKLTPDQHRQRIAEQLDYEGVWQVADLRAARERTVAPLPAEILLLDLWKPIQASHLTDAAALTRWFRQQLSVQWPATGGSQAELVLVLAAGLACAAIPAREVTHARERVFAATIARGLWRKVLHQTPQALRRLDELLQAHSDCLTAAAWPIAPPAGADQAAEEEALRQKLADAKSTALDAEFGPIVDGLTPEQIRELAGEMDQGRGDYVRSKCGKKSPLVRDLLIRWLAQRRSLVVLGPCPGGVR